MTGYRRRVNGAYMPKTKPARKGYYVELPLATIREIKRRTRATKPATPQWQVVVDAVKNSPHC